MLIIDGEMHTGRQARIYANKNKELDEKSRRKLFTTIRQREQELLQIIDTRREQRHIEHREWAL